MSHLFISFSTKDVDFVKELVSKLEDQGILGWASYRDIEPTDEWRKSIDLAIDNSAGLILVITPNSVRSPYVQYEWAYALGKGKTVIQLLLENLDENGMEIDLHPRLEPEQHINFTNPGHKDWGTLLDAAKTLFGLPDPIAVRAVELAEERMISPDQMQREIGLRALMDNQSIAAMTALERAVMYHPFDSMSESAAVCLARKSGFTSPVAMSRLQQSLPQKSTYGQFPDWEIADCLVSYGDQLDEDSYEVLFVWVMNFSDILNDRIDIGNTNLKKDWENAQGLTLAKIWRFLIGEEYQPAYREIEDTLEDEDKHPWVIVSQVFLPSIVNVFPETAMSHLLRFAEENIPYEFPRNHFAIRAVAVMAGINPDMTLDMLERSKFFGQYPHYLEDKLLVYLGDKDYGYVDQSILVKKRYYESR